MTHEAGIWIFGIITLVCLSVWLLCRRSKAVEDAVAPFHYEPMTQDEQDAKNKMWSDLAAQMPLVAPVKWIDKGEFSEMYGETPKPLPKGWQGWEGGECPIPNETMVVVMFRDGTIEAAFPANMFGWKHFDWCGDIVAWRVA